MTAEIGEYVVGAWLREVAGCDFVDYNVRPPVGGSEGQSEFDVVGFHFGDRVAYADALADEQHLTRLAEGPVTIGVDLVSPLEGSRIERMPVRAR
jgi:hypothetical protein